MFNEKKMAIEIYHPFIPLSNRSEGMILGKYKEARDKYLPLIEERTGIDLGTVGVTSLREGIRESFKTSFREAWNESDMLEKTALITLSSVAYPLMELFRMFHEDFFLASYADHRKCIAVAFGFYAKVDYLHRNLTRGFDQRINEIVIHEL